MEVCKQVGVLSLSSLSQTIDLFLNNLQQYGLQRYFNFTMSAVGIMSLARQMLREGIKYSMFLCFPFLLDAIGNAEECSYLLKRIYQSGCTQYKKHEFECAIIVLVKTIRYFVETHFFLIEFDTELEGDIFVLLVHALLGLWITPKAYETVCGRYLVGDALFPTRDNLGQPKKKRLTMRSNKSSLKTRGAQFIDAANSTPYIFNHTPLQHFKNQIKEVLRVDVELPKPKERIKLLTLIKETVNNSSFQHSQLENPFFDLASQQQYIQRAELKKIKYCDEEKNYENVKKITDETTKSSTREKQFFRLPTIKQAKKQIKQKLLNYLKRQKYRQKQSTKLQQSLIKCQRKNKFKRCKTKKIKQKDPNLICSEQISVSLQNQFAKLGIQRIYSNQNIVVGKHRKKKILQFCHHTQRQSLKQSLLQKIITKQIPSILISSKRDNSHLLRKIKRQYFQSKVQIQKFS